MSRTIPRDDHSCCQFPVYVHLSDSGAGWNLPSIHHGGAEKVASHDRTVCSLKMVFHYFNQLQRLQLRLYFNRCNMKSWCTPESEICAVFFVGMMGGNRQEMLGGKLTLFIHFKSCASATYFFMGFPQYRLTPKHHDPIHQFLTARSHSSLRARGHVGCWEDFHPASLSEGWCWLG